MSSPDRPVVLTDEAQRDLRGIAARGRDDWGVEAAARHHAAILRQLELLGSFPLLGRIADDLAGGVREIGVPPHRAYYRVETDVISVLRILHERMDAPRHM